MNPMFLGLEACLPRTPDVPGHEPRMFLEPLTPDVPEVHTCSLNSEMRGPSVRFSLFFHFSFTSWNIFIISENTVVTSSFCHLLLKSCQIFPPISGVSCSSLRLVFGLLHFLGQKMGPKRKFLFPLFGHFTPYNGSKNGASKAPP